VTDEGVVHEVERRYSVSEKQMSAVKEVLCASGFGFSYRQHQVDEYFTSKHKDFISTEECLRIRSIDSSTIFTWKPPSTEEILKSADYWKEEVEFPVDASPSKAKRFLTALDFVSYVTVEKIREAYADDLGSEVACDEVSGLGFFVELEIQSRDIESARKSISQLAENLGLKDEDLSTVPYRDLVFETSKR
jgi:adenylate cyclase class 2